MQSGSNCRESSTICLQNTFLWLHALDRAEILTYLFSTILVSAATVGINNYKYGTDLSLCEIHHEKRGTHSTEFTRCYFPTGLHWAVDLTHSRRKADIEVRREHCFSWTPLAVFQVQYMRLQRSELNACLCHSSTERKASMWAGGKRVPFCLPSQLPEEEAVTAQGPFTAPVPASHSLLCLLSTQLSCKVWSCCSSLLLLHSSSLSRAAGSGGCAGEWRRLLVLLSFPRSCSTHPRLTATLAKHKAALRHSNAFCYLCQHHLISFFLNVRAHRLEGGQH